VTALILFLATDVVLTLRRFPGLRVDRPGAAIIGAGLMLGFRVLSYDQATPAVPGSVANLIAVQRAGIPVTLLSLGFGVVWLMLRG
jgi:hypothetical protein